jgi:hypothetical protein
MPEGLQQSTPLLRSEVLARVAKRGGSFLRVLTFWAHGLDAFDAAPAAGNPLYLLNSVSWPLPGHPEAMKMNCRQGYFHTRLTVLVLALEAYTQPS